MRTILLTQGQIAIVDDQDYEFLSQFKWRATWDRGTSSFYAVRSLSRDLSVVRREERMHRVIMGLSFDDRMQVDHINHATLDNRRENLRIVTNRVNHENQRNQSRFGPGVRRFPGNRKRPFQARAKLDGKICCVGYFATAEEAQRARQKWLEEA